MQTWSARISGRDKLKCGPFAINHECGLLCQIRKRIGLPLAGLPGAAFTEGEARPRVV
jgi:hypothetical protein